MEELFKLAVNCLNLSKFTHRLKRFERENSLPTRNPSVIDLGINQREINNATHRSMKFSI
jgi:hypothetical protein